MSDFKIKVTADLDTSQVEAKLMTLQNRKITIQANAILWILELVSYLSAQRRRQPPPGGRASRRSSVQSWGRPAVFPATL